MQHTDENQSIDSLITRRLANGSTAKMPDVNPLQDTKLTTLQAPGKRAHRVICSWGQGELPICSVPTHWDGPMNDEQGWVQHDVETSMDLHADTIVSTGKSAWSLSRREWLTAWHHIAYDCYKIISILVLNG